MTDRRGVANSVARVTAVVAGAAGIAAGCGNGGADRVLTIDATGQVAGFVFFDQNGTRQFDENVDRQLPGVAVHLALSATGTLVAQATSDSEGLFRVRGVPVGNYTIVVDSTTVGDSAQVVRVDTSAIRVDPEDSVGVTVAVSFPILTVAEAREVPVGEKIFVTGVALSPVVAFADSTLHLRDSTGSLRATRVLSGTVSPGDSGRFLGRKSISIGQPTIDGVTFFSLGSTAMPQPEQVTPIVAATADGGRLDAALVLIPSAVIRDTLRTQGGDYVMRAALDETCILESCAVEVIVDVDLGLVLTQFVPGASISATGVLVPTSDVQQRWALKPRTGSDLRVL